MDKCPHHDQLEKNMERRLDAIQEDVRMIVSHLVPQAQRTNGNGHAPLVHVTATGGSSAVHDQRSVAQPTDSSEAKEDAKVRREWSRWLMGVLGLVLGGVVAHYAPAALAMLQ